MNESLEIRIRNVFSRVLNLTPETEIEKLEQHEHPNWDSIRHVELFIKLSKEFSVQFSAHEVVALTTYRAISSEIAAKVRKQTK